MPKLPLKASIVPFTPATCAVVEQLAPAVVSFHFGFAGARACRARQESRLQGDQLDVAPRSRASWRRTESTLSSRRAPRPAGHRGMFIETDVATQIGTLALVHEIVERGTRAGDRRRAASSMGEALPQRLRSAPPACSSAPPISTALRPRSPLHRAALAEA